MATLYFHIGTTKTATSSIQKFCKLNRKLLRRYGYAFPIMPFSYPRIKNERNAHFLLSGPAGKTVKPKQEQMFRERLETGLSIVHGSLSKYDKVILTDEVLARSQLRTRESSAAFAGGCQNSQL